MNTPLYDFFQKGKNEIRLIDPLHGEVLLLGHVSKETERAVSVYEVDRHKGELRSTWIPKSWFSKSKSPDGIREVININGNTIKVVDAIVKSPWHFQQLKSQIQVKTFSNRITPPTPNNNNHTTPNNNNGTIVKPNPFKNQPF